MSGLMVSFFLCGERAFSASALGDPRPTSKFLNYDQIHSCSLRNLVSFELSNRSGLLHILPPHIRIPRNCTSGISHENVSGHKSMQIYAGTEDSPESPPPGRSLDTLDSSS
jgi:hypothetical protein